MDVAEQFRQVVMEENRPPLEWVPTAEVEAGDRLACLLSDAQAFLTVTGWSDRELDLTACGLGRPVHRTFAVAGGPWWADARMRTFDLAGEALIVKRGTPGAGGGAGRGERQS